MANAIVLIDVESDRINEVAQQVVEIEGVSAVYSVAGDVDLVVVVSTKASEDLATIIPGEIAKVPGIVRTHTLMAFREYSAKQLDEAFNIGLD